MEDWLRCCALREIEDSMDISSACLPERIIPLTLGEGNQYEKSLP